MPLPASTMPLDMSLMARDSSALRTKLETLRLEAVLPFEEHLFEFA